MKKKILIIFCTLVFFALTATSIMSGTAGAKSLYTIAAINASPTPIEAYNIEANGSLTFQAGYGVPSYSGGAVGIAIDSDSATLFVTYEFTNIIQLLDATTMADLGTTTAPGASNLAGIVVDQDKGLLYTIDRNTNDLYIYKWYPSNTTLILQNTQELANLTSGYGLALDEINDVLYVADYYYSDYGVKYYDTATWTNLGEFTTSHQPQSIAVDATNQFIYTGSGKGSSHIITKYNMNNGTEVTKDIGQSALGMAVDPASSFLYCNAGVYVGSLSTIRAFDSDLNQLFSTSFNYSYPSPTGLCIPGQDISYNPLNLTKDDGLEEEECVSPGENINYTICFDNGLNEFDIHNVTLEDTLPANVSFDGASDGGTYDGVNHTVNWDLGTILSGEGDCIWLLVQVDSSTPPETTITNYVTIDSDETPPTTQSETTLTCNFTEDTTPPIQTIEFGRPNIEVEWFNTTYNVTSCNTPIWINSSDPGGVGSSHINYSVWRADDPYPNPSGQIVFIRLYNKTVNDGDPEDADPANGSISVIEFMEESCIHEIIYQCWDYNNNTDGERDKDFIADCCGPETTKEIGEPQYGEGYPNWCSDETPLWFNSTDRCCLPNGTAVDYIVIEVHWKSTDDPQQPWTWNDTIIVYDNSSEDDDTRDGRISYEFHFEDNCFHELRWYGVDIFGNVEATSKQKHYVDVSEPEIFKTVGDPNCTEDNITWCVTTDTPIEFYAEDRGCMGGVGLDIVEFRVWYDGWSGWTDLEELEGEPFYFEDPCMHYLEIRAIDLLNNTALDNETFYVDDTDPIIVKTVGNPNCTTNNDVDYCVTTKTPINITAFDPGCCEDITLEYRVNGGNWVDITDQRPFIYKFTSQCFHTLDIRAYDCLGHIVYDNETFYVDDKPPKINKTVGEPKWPGSNNQPDWYVTSNTPITINVSEDGCCGILEYAGYSINGSPWINITGNMPWTLWFPNDCVHNLSIVAWDCLGNIIYHNETFYVDNVPPDVTKEIGQKHILIGDTNDYMISGLTPIWINITDNGTGPCIVGSVHLHYRYWYNGSWSDWINKSLASGTLVEEIHLLGTCKHYLEFWVEDNLGNRWPPVCGYDNETFYVDDTPPTISKTIHPPNCYHSTSCTSDLTNPGFETGDLTGWIIIEEADQITVTAADMFTSPYTGTYMAKLGDDNNSGNQPIGNNMISQEFVVTQDTFMFAYNIFTYDWFGFDLFAYTLKTADGVYTLADYSQTAWGPVGDTSLKTTGWRVVAIDTSFFIGESLNFTITCGGTIDPFYPIWTYVDCAPDTDYYVTTHTNITITAQDIGCITDELLTNVSYNINNTGWIEIEELPFNLLFDNECIHTLDIKAVDYWGNTLYHNETFHVDDTPPDTEKTFDGPTYDDNYWLRDNDTWVIINATDYEEPCAVGVTHMHVELWYASDGFNIDILLWMLDIYDNDGNDFNGALGEIQYKFQIMEDCLHEIVWYAVDCLGNKEETNYQQHRVDSTPPEIIKKVGEPSFTKDNKTWWVTTETEINLSAIDHLEPCAVGVDTLEYRIWFQGTWSGWINYTGNFTFERGCTHYLEVKATDYLGNYAIDNETFIVHGPSGDSDPNVEIIYPEFGSTQNVKTLEVKINATDDLTDWENLDVYLWIPGGRRDAPDLWYDVYLGDEENEYLADVDIYNYQDGAQITLYSSAVDEDGNVGFAIPVTFTVHSTIVWDQWMQEGWNPMTLPPEIGCNNSVERILSSISGSYDWIFYDDPEDGWKSYSPDLDPIYVTLTEIQGGKQYWVHITNESGIRYYIGLPEIEILNPEDGSTLESLDEINGTAWDSETAIEEVSIQIYYKDEGNTKHYWNDTDWTEDSVYLPCVLEGVYMQTWSYNSSEVNWIPGETFYVKARATDGFGCPVYDVASFTITSYTISGTVYLNESIVLELGDTLIVVYNNYDEWPPLGPEDFLIAENITDPVMPFSYDFDVFNGSYYVVALLINTSGESPYAAGAAHNVTPDDLLNVSIGPDEIVVAGADVTDQDITLYLITEEEEE